ncbi:DUF4179 domain-containing protein [Paenibacillus tianmuensis]|nr:DUF4179 domain-containing protein [Paenibacillus tianmuensis]
MENILGQRIIEEEFLNHLKLCERCRKLYEECKTEENNLHQLLFNFELPDIKDPPFMNTIETLLKQKRRKAKNLKHFILAACFLIFITGIYTSPTIAQYIQSFFKDNAVTDRGLLEAYETDIPIYPNVTVSDKKYRVQVNEIIADSTRVVMALKIVDDNGSYNHDLLRLNDENEISLVDPINNKKLAVFDDIGSTEDFNYLVAKLDEDFPGKNLKIVGKISKLKNGETITTGNWSFNIPVNIEKNQREIKNLKEKFVTSNNLEIELTRLVYTSTGGRLELKVKPSMDYKKELFMRHSLMFHLEDMNGNEISTVGSSKIGITNDLLSSIKKFDEKEHVMYWTYTFKYLPKSPIRFVLDGYRILENSNESFAFNPETLATAPLSFDSMNDEFILTGFEQNNDEAILRMKGKFFNGFSGDIWKVVDKDGNEYDVRTGGAYISQNDIITLQDEKLNTNYGFRINQLPLKNYEQLILKRKVIERRYQSNWAVIIGN